MICCFETGVLLIQQQPRRWLTCYYFESKTGSTSMDVARKVDLKLTWPFRAFSEWTYMMQMMSINQIWWVAAGLQAGTPEKSWPFTGPALILIKTPVFAPPSFCLPSSLTMFYILEFQSNCGACGSLPPHSSPSYVTPLHIACSVGTS